MQARTTQRIRVLVASDIRFYSDGLGQLLAGYPGIEVVATAAGAAQAWTLASDYHPDVVLVDVGMDQALTLLHDLDNITPPCRKVAVAIRDDEAAILQWAEA
ncbi:MAG TPA: hypothetical protein VHO95_08240, partial [Candidatus Dormibacteraeota bacterium]|nr:hypothetical protein [Candidatus Dormibacteraeota bacterium]